MISFMRVTCWAVMLSAGTPSSDSTEISSGVPLSAAGMSAMNRFKRLRVSALV